MLKNLIKYLSIFIILLSIMLPLSLSGLTKIAAIKEEKTLTKNIAANNYYAVLSIPKINLKKALYPISSKENNVNKNLELLNATMPTNQKSNVIIAGHSGNGLHAYFKDLYKLTVNDEIILLYENINYTYQVSEIEYQAKTGNLYLKVIKTLKQFTIVSLKISLKMSKND